MQKNVFKILFIFLLFQGSQIMTSCQKKCDVPQPSQKEKLMDGGWKGKRIEEYDNNGDLVTTYNITGTKWYFLDNNNMILYYADGSYEVDPYRTDEDVSVIHMLDPGNSFDFIVNELSETKLQMDTDFGAHNGSVYKYYLEK